MRARDEAYLSGIRKQTARKRALAAELGRVGRALRAGARLASVRGAASGAWDKFDNGGQPRRLGNFSQRAGDCVACAGRVPLAACEIAVAAAEPVDRDVCFYWRDSRFSAGGDFADRSEERRVGNARR